MSKRNRQISKAKKEPFFSKKKCWDLSTHLARTISGGLRSFIRMKRYGYPVTYLPEDQRISTSEETEEKAKKQWESDLRSMLFSFEEISNDYPSNPWTIYNDRERKKLEKQGIEPYTIKEDGTFLCRIPPEPEEIRQKEQEYQEKIKNGLKLFAEHFESLWD